MSEKVKIKTVEVRPKIYKSLDKNLSSSSTHEENHVDGVFYSNAILPDGVFYHEGTICPLFK